MSAAHTATPRKQFRKARVAAKICLPFGTDLLDAMERSAYTLIVENAQRLDALAIRHAIRTCDTAFMRDVHPCRAYPVRAALAKAGAA